MAINSAFTPTGNTVVINVTASASTPVQVTTNGAASNQYRIINASGANGIFLSYSQTSANATANCVIPTANASTTTLFILPNTDEIITFVPSAYFAAIGQGTATIYIVPGDGM
jgi:hypothetical protein